MKCSGCFPTVHQFPHSTEKLLKMYALAASAAALGLVSPADAKIIYKPADQSIARGFPLDVNNDGVVDCNFYYYWGVSASSEWERWVIWIGADTPQPNRLWLSALPTRILIGPNGQKFDRTYGQLAWWSRYWQRRTSGTSRTSAGGVWLKQTNRYLGLMFQINEKTHYGWARLTVDWKVGSATLTGYAYETVPNKPILIGNGHLVAADESRASVTTFAPPIAERGSLGRLALGAAGSKPKFGNRPH